MIKWHLVGGFLGSGKTTAIIQACKRLLQTGQKVGVITNDQGKYLVDTAFFAWRMYLLWKWVGDVFVAIMSTRTKSWAS